MTRYMYIILNFFKYAQKSCTYVAEALTPLPRLGTFSWIVARDSHQKILNSQPWSRPTRQRSAAHQWAAAHRLRTADVDYLSVQASLYLCMHVLSVYVCFYVSMHECACLCIYLCTYICMHVSKDLCKNVCIYIYIYMYIYIYIYIYIYSVIHTYIYA